MTLPPWPIDDQALDLLYQAVRPGPEAAQSSLYDLCSLFSQLGGSDTAAVAEVIDDSTRVMRDPQYHHNDVIAALVEEIRRLRAATPTRPEQPPPVPNDRPPVVPQVIVDMRERMELGIRRYGRALQPHNGRDTLLDAYEEAMDLVIYLKALLLERETTT